MPTFHLTKDCSRSELGCRNWKVIGYIQLKSDKGYAGMNIVWSFGYLWASKLGIQESPRLDIVGLQAVEPVVKPIRWHTPCSFLFPRFGVMERGILEVSSRQYSVSQKFSYIVDSNILQNLLQPAMPMSQNFSYIERSTTKRFLRASRVFPRPLLTMSQTK